MSWFGPTPSTPACRSRSRRRLVQVGPPASRRGERGPLRQISRNPRPAVSPSNAPISSLPGRDQPIGAVAERLYQFDAGGRVPLGVRRGGPPPLPPPPPGGGDVPR